MHAKVYSMSCYKFNIINMLVMANINSIANQVMAVTNGSQMRNNILNIPCPVALNGLFIIELLQFNGD